MRQFDAPASGRSADAALVIVKRRFGHVTWRSCPSQAGGGVPKRRQKCCCAGGISHAAPPVMVCPREVADYLMPDVAGGWTELPLPEDASLSSTS